jgi:hypothetical protein
MARYHFRLVDLDDVLRTLVTADLDSFEEVEERAELLAHLLLMVESDWYSYEDDPREILVTDENGHKVLELALSKIKQNLFDN